MKRKFKRSAGPHMTTNPPLEPKQRICSQCGLRGGTLEKDNGGFRHQNRKFCREAKKVEDRRKAAEYMEKLKAKEEEGGQLPDRVESSEGVQS